MPICAFSALCIQTIEPVWHRQEHDDISTILATRFGKSWLVNGQVVTLEWNMKRMNVLRDKIQFKLPFVGIPSTLREGAKENTRVCRSLQRVLCVSGTIQIDFLTLISVRLQIKLFCQQLLQLFSYMLSAKSLRIKILLVLIMMSQLVACTIIPGQHMRAFSTQSSVEFPVAENNETILRKLNIQTINAQLIIDLEKNFNNRSLGPNNVANHYFNYRIGSRAIKGTPDKESYSQYRVGPRDILVITVWGHPELTIPAGEFRSAEAAGNVVGEDGTFFYPFVGVVQAAGRTVEEIRGELTQKLSHYIERVQLDVRVAGYRSQRVYVVGEVAQPGVHLVKDIPLTVLEAINNAGGVKPDADLRNITLTRNDKVYSINLLSLYEGGDVTQNVLLQHGDVLNVPDNQLNKVFVLGETTFGRSFAPRPRSLVMNKARMTLTEALSEAGGMDQEIADAARVFVFRSNLGKSEIFHLDAKSPDALILADRFPLQPRDVVYVDRVEGIRWNQIVAQIIPTIQLLNVFDGSLNVQPFRSFP